MNQNIDDDKINQIKNCNNDSKEDENDDYNYIGKNENDEDYILYKSKEEDMRIDKNEEEFYICKTILNFN